jgi:iron complex transport system substrate-binding protein
MKNLISRLQLCAWVFCGFSTVTLQAAERIVSVGGDVTELVYALDSADKLIGIDISSTYPASIQELPKIGYQRNLSTEGILSLKPDLVLHNELAGPPAVLKQLKATSLQVESLPTTYNLADLQAKVTRLGTILDKAQAAEKLNRQLAEDYATLEKLKADNPSQSKVIFIMNHGGGAPMVAGYGTAADAVINLAGAKNAAAFARYKPLTPEALVTASPDIILLTDMTAEQIGGVDKVWSLPGVSLTPAARNKRIVVMDAQSLLSFGPRIFQVAADLNRQLRETMQVTDSSTPVVSTLAKQ